MKITYADEFIRKASTPHYPMLGYYAQLVQKMEKSWFYKWTLINSNLYACNTFLLEDTARISIDITKRNDQINVTNYIYLFAIDLLQYRGISDFDGPKDPKLFSQIAAIIDLEIIGMTDVIDKTVTNIFDLGYLPKCSFNCVYGEGQKQVKHYNSNEVGKVSYFDDSLEESQFISRESGIDKVRESVTYYKPHKLSGSMSIRKSGIIEL